MLKKLISSSSSLLSKMEMKSVKGGITREMADCQTGAWGCWNTPFCIQKCGAGYCCNECPSYSLCQTIIIM